MQGSYIDTEERVYGWEQMKDMNLIVVNEQKTITYVSPELNGSLFLDKEVIGIGKKAFQGCQLTAIVFNDELQFIGDLAFLNCDKITGLNLPVGVSRIGVGITAGCTSLNTIKTYIGGKFYVKGNCIYDSGHNIIAGCNNSTLIGASSLKQMSFVGFSFKQLSIYNCGLIEKNAFVKTSIGKLLILGGPSVVTSIQKDAFVKCKIPYIGVDSRVPALTLPKESKITTVDAGQLKDFGSTVDEVL